jgi:hypothetical protein
MLTTQIHDCYMSRSYVQPNLCYHARRGWSCMRPCSHHSWESSAREDWINCLGWYNTRKSALAHNDVIHLRDAAGCRPLGEYLLHLKGTTLLRQDVPLNAARALHECHLFLIRDGRERGSTQALSPLCLARHAQMCGVPRGQRGNHAQGHGTQLQAGGHHSLRAEVDRHKANCFVRSVCRPSTSWRQACSPRLCEHHSSACTHLLAQVRNAATRR